MYMQLINFLQFEFVALGEVVTIKEGLFHQSFVQKF